MSLTGPIILIDDDHDDLFLIQNILTELHVPNYLHFFQNGQIALDYLWSTKEKPLLILCDMNMPIMNGLELRRNINASPYLSNKSIPFIFFSTACDIKLIDEAYQSNIQGFYKKEHSYEELKQSVETIIRYWKSCLHPNNF
jgi:CheY-like chemotaxis protein